MMIDSVVYPNMNNFISSPTDGKNHQLRSLRKIQEELSSEITEEISSSDRELFDMIADFQKNLERAEDKQRKVRFQVELYFGYNCLIPQRDVKLIPIYLLS